MKDVAAGIPVWMATYSLNTLTTCLTFYIYIYFSLLYTFVAKYLQYKICTALYTVLSGNAHACMYKQTHYYSLLYLTFLWIEFSLWMLKRVWGYACLWISLGTVEDAVYWFKLFGGIEWSSEFKFLFSTGSLLRESLPRQRCGIAGECVQSCGIMLCVLNRILLSINSLGCLVQSFLSHISLFLSIIKNTLTQCHNGYCCYPVVFPVGIWNHSSSTTWLSFPFVGVFVGVFVFVPNASENVAKD